METIRLRQFKTIVDCGGLLKAGELLGISGGGLSKSMKVLQDELGYELFVQRGRGLELTPAGRELYSKVPTLLKMIEDILGQKGLSSTVADSFKIVSFEVFTTYFLGSIAREVFGHRPFDIRNAIPGQMESLVAEGQSDLGLTYLPIPHAGVDFIKVGRIQMGAFGVKDLWKGRDFADLPFVVPVAPIQGTPSGVQGLDGWPEHLFVRRIHYRVEMMETALQISRHGLAAAFLPEFIVGLANRQVIDRYRLHEIPLPEAVKSIHREIYLIHRKGTKESKEIRALAKELRRLS